MRSRQVLRSVVVVAVLGLVQVFTGCKTSVDDPQPVDFGAIRVLNYAAGKGAVDVYIQGAGQPIDTLATAQNLAFGLATPYTNNLATAPGGTVYHVSIHPVNNKTTELTHADVTVKPGEKWTVTVYYDASSSTYPTDALQDAPTTSGTPPSDKVYIRFLNAYTSNSFNKADYSAQGVDVRIGDNLNPHHFADNVKFRQITPYVEVPFKTDTTYTFFVTDPTGGDSVIVRMAGISFDPGSHHTLVFTADLSKTGSLAQDPTIGDPQDSLRLRILDDNTAGNDITTPAIPQTLRFNYINALINAPNLDTTIKRYYQQLGIVINNDGNITFPNMNPLDVAPASPFASYTDASGQKIWVTQFTSIPLTPAVDIKGFRTDGLAPQQRGQLLFDYKAGDRRQILSDVPVSIMIIDTPLALSRLNDSTTVSQVAVPIPDNAISGMARIVLVNGLAGTHAATTPVASYVTFNVNGTPVTSFTGGKKPTTYDNTTKVTADGSTPVTIDAGLPAKGGLPLETVSVTFTPKSGKIYEVVLVGQRGANATTKPQYIVVETNPTQP